MPKSGERTPARDVYGYDEFDDSPLTDDDIEVFRGGVKALLCGMPGYQYVEPGHPAIDCIELNRDLSSELGLVVYLDETKLDALVIPDERINSEGEHEPTDGDAHNLRDLGSEWEHLEAHLISEMVTMLDLPEYTDELEDYVTGDLNLYCTQVIGDTANFVAWFHIPEYIRTMYDEDRFDIAEKFGIPMLD